MPVALARVKPLSRDLPYAIRRATAPFPRPWRRVPSSAANPRRADWNIMNFGGSRPAFFWLW